MDKKNTANQLAKECMVTALIQLLMEKNLSEITISELSRRAGVSRMTYYRNYTSKEDIFIQYLHEIFALYYQEFNQSNQNSEFYDMPNMIHCFHYFSIHKELLNTLFDNNLGELFFKELTNYILSVWYKENDSIERYYILQAFSGSLCNLYLSWAANDTRLSIEELATIVHSIYS